MGSLVVISQEAETRVTGVNPLLLLKGPQTNLSKAFLITLGSSGHCLDGSRTWKTCTRRGAVLSRSAGTPGHTEQLLTQKPHRPQGTGGCNSPSVAG